MRLHLAITVATLALAAPVVAEPLRFMQVRDNAPVVPLPASERARLGDPLFQLVLADHAEVTALDALEERIQPDSSKRQVFVVSEDILDTAQSGARRAVIAFKGSNRGIVLDGNVFLSVFFGANGFSPSIEAIGWDAHRGRYNYYKADGGPGRRAWKFRGSSDGADLLSMDDNAERAGTCLQCHVNGAPVMKELLFPWNNWHSDVSRSPATYLKRFEPNHWPVAETPRLKQLADAARLESTVLSAVRQFNRHRINQVLEREPQRGNVAEVDGKQRVMEGRRILRPLFQSTEVNLISARKAKSGLHPLPEPSTTGPDEDVAIPESFFLNAELLAGGGIPKYRGLGIADARKFKDVATVKPAEYRQLVAEARLRLHGRTPADADFAWLVPERSHIDNELVDQLMERGIVSPQLVAAVMAVDLRHPVFSEERAALLRFVPERFRFTPLPDGTDPMSAARHPDELTQEIIEALTAQPLRRSPAQRLFLERLLDPDPVARLREDVAAYLEEVRRKLADGSTRPAELRRLFDQAIERRRQLLAHPVLGHLDETQGTRLLPLPAP